MKIFRICWKRAGAMLKKIHLVDKCLLIFMAVLLLQSAYSLFANSNSFTEVTHIDVVIRTSAAGIFGYFLSANFTYRTLSKKEKDTVIVRDPPRSIEETADSASPQARIGFADSENAPDAQLGRASSTASPPENPDVMSGQLQIITATCIGLFCLLVLIFVRNMADTAINMTASSASTTTATVAQLRDFVSGCVGFLIGCPTDGNESKS